PVRRDRNAIHNLVNGISQKLKARDQSNVELAGREFSAQRRWMIQNHCARPAMDQRPSVEIFDATDPQRTSLGAGCLGFNSGDARSVRRSRSDMTIMTVALHRFAASLANSMFERGDRLLLRRRRTRHVENFLIEHCPVKF